MTPRLQEALVRLSTHIPSFAKAARELAFFTGATVHADTARRRTEAAGALLVAYETAQVERILHDHPPAPCSPDSVVLGVDGAMVPLVGGQWTEVRTLAVGEVQPVAASAGGAGVQTTNLSYFSRRTDSTTFADLALVELHRRGIEAAGRVAAVVDGASWCQSFIDLHYGEAVRILDFAHAAEYLTLIAQTVGEHGPLLSPAELEHLRHTLKHHGPATVLERLREVVASQAANTELSTALAYLEAREEQMQYPQFVAAGWPIGSGMVESANKLVVEDRLKGAGMRWADVNINPVLALRNAVCNDRWEACWMVIEREQRRQQVLQRQARRAQRRVAVEPEAGTQAAEPVTPVPVEPMSKPAEPETKSVHPWRRAWSIRRQRELANAA